MSSDVAATATASEPPSIAAFNADRTLVDICASRYEMVQMGNVAGQGKVAERHKRMSQACAEAPAPTAAKNCH
jgi:hypothetical protein